MEEVLCRIGRAHRGLRGDHSGGERNGQNPKAERRAAAPAEDGEGRLFCFAMQRPEGPAENSRTQPLPARAACRPIAL
ncbi:hypothetical protein LMTR13_12180 [Bradyrhizobium icense]|uniref:Uncharacterized protein n=1 Tax=Bradyrhizobium icense TaxID=1274631 RepID=A0A1B1UDH0_9BRAD|nr:hypothetical protein LMTR13_12180 [Bradyrhizobium icense]